MNAERLETRQSPGKIPVTGVTGNGIQVRMELRTMQQQYPDMFNVFLLGLRSFMQMDQSDPLSYYQIAGIHGRPYVPWDGIGSAPGFGGGYCTHTSNLFLPWHRPYLALIEQELYKHVQQAAQSFPAGATRDKYVAAAQNWRFPYWDWAAIPCSSCKAFPTLLSDQWATVTTPTGVQTIPNPLFRYDFHPVSVSDMVYNPFASWDVTKRYPTSWDASASSQNNLLNNIFANSQSNYRDRLYNLYTNYNNFSQFGDSAWISSSSTNADSLESIHDAIHSSVGNNGHMTYLDYAAFDPVFWLHHVMVDRSFALWQTLHTDTYVEPLAAVGSTFTYPAGTVNDEDSALTPFFKDTAGTNWTSTGVRDMTTFGYTYPELQNGASASSVRASINMLYGKNALSADAIASANAGNGPYLNTTVSANGTDDFHHEYICNIVSQKFAMNGSYAVYVFLGNVSTNSTEELQLSHNLVGTYSVFSNMPSDNNHMADMDLKITGTVPLTTSLLGKLESGELQSMLPAHVEPYLRKNLQWRVAKYEGGEVNVADVPDLSLNVVSAPITPAASENEFPQWGAFTALTSVTAGKPGGYSAEYWNCPEDGSSFDSSYSRPAPAPVAPAAPASSAVGPYGNGTAASPVAPQGTGSVSSMTPTTYTGAASMLSLSGYAIALAAAALVI
ncbi:Di-copper centre-containing protein [Aureobasidium melanogenum CBS 110374]|uniref:tyrosinase n=1 Tax=Aureobasidium melanogenum (strain CBS 110374) TaxID=1043003 RepID=A0A074VIF5_AURM1|nr:Di-copper centre-containing protein [Aureobasidium melanogenum CBS 110374]KEQ58869.1 Di-copper centre-containing protein [Aureobasidium melanogenum CBS 110374]